MSKENSEKLEQLKFGAIAWLTKKNYLGGKNLMVVTKWKYFQKKLSEKNGVVSQTDEKRLNNLQKNTNKENILEKIAVKNIFGTTVEMKKRQKRIWKTTNEEIYMKKRSKTTAV